MKLNIKTNIQYEDQLPGAEFPRNMALMHVRRLNPSPRHALLATASPVGNGTSRPRTQSHRWQALAAVRRALRDAVATEFRNPLLAACRTQTILILSRCSIRRKGVASRLPTCRAWPPWPGPRW